MLLIQKLLLSFINGNNATIAMHICNKNSHNDIKYKHEYADFSEVAIINLKLFVHFVKKNNNKCMQ